MKKKKTTMTEWMSEMQFEFMNRPTQIKFTGITRKQSVIKEHFNMIIKALAIGFAITMFRIFLFSRGV